MKGVKEGKGGGWRRNNNDVFYEISREKRAEWTKEENESLKRILDIGENGKIPVIKKEKVNYLFVYCKIRVHSSYSYQTIHLILYLLASPCLNAPILKAIICSYNYIIVFIYHLAFLPYFFLLFFFVTFPAEIIFTQPYGHLPEVDVKENGKWVKKRGRRIFVNELFWLSYPFWNVLLLFCYAEAVLSHPFFHGVDHHHCTKTRVTLSNHILFL